MRLINNGFCKQLPRPEYSSFDKYKSSTNWFEVFEVEKNIWAIYEAFQWSEVISYLIVGTQTALLFDTGNGIDNINDVVSQLTDKPLQVLNSHSHFDHIGGNYQFKEILSPSSAFSIKNSQGNHSQQVKTEASS